MFAILPSPAWLDDIDTTESADHVANFHINDNLSLSHRHACAWGLAEVKMASHQLAIAKASLSAGLLKPDPTSLHREEIAHFHSLLERALTQCTAANVQV